MKAHKSQRRRRRAGQRSHKAKFESQRQVSVELAAQALDLLFLLPPEPYCRANTMFSKENIAFAR